MESTSTSIFVSKKYKAFLTVFVALCIVGVAVVVIVATHPSTRAKSTVDEGVSARDIELESHEQDSDEPDDRKHTLDTGNLKLPQSSRILKRTSQKKLMRESRSVKNHQVFGGEDLTPCYSDSANDTIPAAHISGHGGKPLSDSTSQSSTVRRGFQQKWRCNGYLNKYGFHAFVDGGMVFNQMDKSLQVPVCGYYHITSQVLFKIDSKESGRMPTEIYHSLKFHNNCGANQPEELAVLGSNMVTATGAKATTHTSDVVHLCEGAKIWVEIPDGPHRNPCCPMADEEQTFIAAYLISKTSCSWPREIRNRRQ